MNIFRICLVSTNVGRNKLKKGFDLLWDFQLCDLKPTAPPPGNEEKVEVDDNNTEMLNMKHSNALSYSQKIICDKSITITKHELKINCKLSDTITEANIYK